MQTTKTITETKCDCCLEVIGQDATVHPHEVNGRSIELCEGCLEKFGLVLKCLATAGVDLTVLGLKSLPMTTAQAWVSEFGIEA